MNVFVIGGCHHNALGVIRSLGEKGIRPYVVIQSDEEKPYIRLSRYISQYWIVASEQEVLAILKNEAVHFHGEKAVLITCADNLSSLVDMNHDELRQWYYLPGTDEQGRVTRLMDKEVMSQLGRETRLLVPMSIACSVEQETIIDIPLPWIVKPLVSKDGAKTDIERIYTAEQWKKYSKIHRLDVLVQQLIDKDFEFQLIGLSLRGGEDVIIPGVSHVIRPSATTNTGFLYYTSLDSSFQEVLARSEVFLRKTGYSGLFSIEFLRGKDGKDYFMEINFRNDGNAICVTAAGINLPYMWYLYHTDGDYRRELAESQVKSVYVMPEFEDLSLVIHRHLSLFSWMKDILHTSRFMEFDRHDMKPFWSLLAVSINRWLKKLLHCLSTNGYE
ncbi:MAG: carboxylate--amine ligase [Prevotella sp.]|nr:carboxylate--amine ligase [Prevotella sp.]MBR4365071.1 carboxylate--amine ligase [Prevotella sp.]